VFWQLTTNRVSLKITCYSLKILGYDVITSADGEEALKLVESEKPVVMLLDVLMPGMDGFKTLERLRVFSNLQLLS
jgi:CheY-like chemotaxis protein